MYFVYVLESENFGIRYTGLTSDIEKRLKEHNRGQNKSTKPYIPYHVIYYETVGSLEDARKREKYLKSAAGRAYIKKAIKLTTDQKPARLDVSQAGLGV